MAYLKKTQSNRVLLRRFAGISAIALIFIALASWGLYASLYRQERIKLKADFERNLALGEFYLTKELQGLTSDLELIASSSVLQDYLNAPSDRLRQLVEYRFSDFVNFRRRYDQVRLLDPQGMEKIRVNYFSGQALVVPAEQLQSKAHRYYFQQAINLPPGIFYVSPLDLNVENETVETPLKPMIRVANKLTNDAGSTMGVLVINYLAEALIRGLNDVYPAGPGQLLLVNKDGYYLKGPSAELEWGFMLTARKDYHLAQEFPELWMQIEQASSGFAITAEQILGYQSLNPTKLLVNPDAQHVAPQSISRRWTLLTMLPSSVLRESMAPHRRTLILGAMSLALLSLVSAFFYARTTLHRDEYNQQSRQLVAALEESPLGIAIAAEDGAVNYANQRFFAITGLSENQVLERPLWCLDKRYVPSDLPATISAALEARRPWQGRFRSQTTEGQGGDVELLVSWLEDNAQAMGEIIVVLRDITHETELETQLRQAQKMEAVGQLAAGVAHDFNNLLQVILGSATLINRRVQPEGKFAALLDGILQAAEKGAVLTRQLLTFSKRKALSRETVIPDDLVFATLKMIQRLLGEQVSVSFHPGGEGGCLMADPGMLEQALINLCINARDAMPNGGSLVLRSAVITPQEHHEALEGADLGSFWYRLSISDTGVGIPEELQERIFEPFFTTKPSGRGTGLGLATVYAIVSRHDGQIKVSSTPQKGTTFDLFLPICSSDSCAAASSQREAVELVSGQGETILLAEDDEQVLGFACDLLEEAGYRVLTAEDGARAVAQFEKHHQEIRLVLLDVIMPAMNGRQVFEFIRKVKPGVPVIFTSGHDYNLLNDIGLNSSEHEVISKPYTPALLLGKIAEKLKQCQADHLP